MDRVLCYNNVKGDEIDAKNHYDCKIPIQYNHTFVVLPRPQFMPSEGRTVAVLQYLRLFYEFKAEIKMFHAKPLDNQSMMLAMKRDFK